MKSKAILLTLMLLCAYVAATAFLWPLHDKLLPAAPAQNPALALENLSPQAPLSLIVEPDGVQQIIQAIQTASSSVELVTYELEDQQIEQALAAAHARGVEVRVLLDNLDSFGNYPNQAAFEYLKAQGVEVEWSPSYFALTHQKTLVVDTREAFIMTFNFTPQYYASSRDFAILDDDQTDVSAIEAAFNSDWSGNQEAAPTADDLLWSPGAWPTTLALIQSASSTLDIYNEEMADLRVISALEAAAARGVSVRVNMTYDTSWKSALNELKAAGVEVRTYASSAKFYIHAKVIVADNKEAFVGSQNFSQQSLDSNRELGILLVKPDIIAQLETTFNQDWSGSRPY